MSARDHAQSATGPVPAANRSPALKPSEVLSKAADLIEPEGAWAQGLYRVPGGPGRAGVSFGIGGAIDWAVESATADPKRQMALRGDANLALAICLKTMRPGSWERAPNRTQSEVVEALRKAAELARAEGQ